MIESIVKLVFQINQLLLLSILSLWLEAYSLLSLEELSLEEEELDFTFLADALAFATTFSLEDEEEEEEEMPEEEESEEESRFLGGAFLVSVFLGSSFFLGSSLWDFFFWGGLEEELLEEDLFCCFLAGLF